MKKIIFALLLCLFATNVFCEDVDGREWSKMSDLTRVNYIIGFSECYTKLISSMQLPFQDILTQFAKGTSDKKLDKETKKRIEDVSFDMAKSYDEYPYGYTYGEIRDFTNTFFANPQYKTLKLDDVLTIIIFPALKNSWSKEDIDNTALLLLKATKTEREQSVTVEKPKNSPNINKSAYYDYIESTDDSDIGFFNNLNKKQGNK